MFKELTKYVGTTDHARNIISSYGAIDYGLWLEYQIGDSTTIFTAHIDDVAVKAEKVSHAISGRFIYNKNGILGADDKAGVSIMLRMIENNIPGIYLFFDKEESGRIGSKQYVKNIKNNIERVVSFDRRGYSDIITTQLGQECCSDIFAAELSERLAKHNMYFTEADGIYTDSASFMDNVPECTNLSVGYFDNHSSCERQDMLFLDRLAEVACKIDWESLPVCRTPRPINHGRYKCRLAAWDEYIENVEYMACDVCELYNYCDKNCRRLK